MRIAFFIPCLNEELTIAKVVRDCRRAIPEAHVFVFDNGSTDDTAALARDAGADVVWSSRAGKGAVVRHAFATIDADYLIMLDGDGTYPAAEARRLVDFAASKEAYDMVSGARLQNGPVDAFPPLHFFGNRAFTFSARVFFGADVADLLTGFRCFSRAFVEDTTLRSTGFEIETELTLRALAEGRKTLEVPIAYSNRPAGSASKLRTFRDGLRIAMTMLGLVIEYRVLRRRPAPRAARSRDHSRAS